MLKTYKARPLLGNETTMAENMQRIMVPPTYNSLKANEEYSPMDKNVSMTKNIKPNIPIETKYCEVPYSGNPVIHEQKSVRNTELSASNVNPVLTRSAPQGWPSHLRQSRPYGAPELYQYPDYTNCAGPRPVPMTRPHRTAHEDLSHGYVDPYCHDVRFKPYTTVKDRYPQARYEFISNYPSPFHPPSAYPPHKYDMQKSIPQPYTYQQVPLKYLDNRIPEPVMDGYQRPPQQSNYNLPFHNQMIHPAYGPIVGNCIQNKYTCPPEGSVKPVAPNKQPYETNKMYAEYEKARSQAFPVSENYYFNEMQRPPPHIKNQVMPNYAINMHRFPPHTYYTKDNASLKNYEYMSHFRNMDPSMLSQSRIPSQFSPNGITISPSDPNINLDNPHIQGNSPEDYGYVSQSPTGSIRNTDYTINRSTNEFYRRYDSRYGHGIRPPTMMAKHEQNLSEHSKDKKDIDVRQFLQMWNEVDDENSESASKEPITQFSTDVNKPTSQYETVKNQDQLYVLGLVNVPSEELGKYEHIQKVSKLPENIKGYNSIELLNQFEEAIESSNVNNFKTKSSTPNDIAYQMTMKNSSSHLSLLPRPVSPLDVEAKISQSVIHKEVGCNFEIKPCSPKMLNVEAATPIQNLLGERVIEKVSNPLIITSPMMHSEDKSDYNVLNHQEQRKSSNESVKNTSCKMINTQFNSDNDTARSNYSLQDLESNSGICLASLPRLDNDIELNFPEVNQQFINANKVESVITATKDLPSLSLENIDNINSTESDNNICQKLNELPSVNDTEKEFSKLSRYRKIKKIGHEPVETEMSFSSTQNMRTDSVIIKNPDNPKIFEQNKEILTVESSLVRGKDLPDNEHFNDKVDTNKEHSNKLNSAELDDHTDIAIDFSLNKSDNNPSGTIEFIENGTKLDSSKINSFTKHSEISQTTELLRDHKTENQTKIKTLPNAEPLLNDKYDLEKQNCSSDKKENEYSQIETKLELNEFDTCKNIDDKMSLGRDSKEIDKSDVNIFCELKSQQGITLTTHEENENESEKNNLTSVTLSVNDFVNEKESKEINVDTISQIIDSNPDIQFDEKSNLDFSDLCVENAISSPIVQCASDAEKDNKEEIESQESDGVNIDATFANRTDSRHSNRDNEIISTQNYPNDQDQPNLQNTQNGETDSKHDLFPKDGNEYNTDATLKNETDFVKETLDMTICCKEENNSIEVEDIYMQQDAQKESDIKDNYFLEGEDNSDIPFRTKTVTQDKLASNLGCCEYFNSSIGKKDIVTLQSKITLELQDYLLNKSFESESKNQQVVSNNKQTHTKNNLEESYGKNDNILSKINIELKDMTQDSSSSIELIKNEDKESDIICRDNSLSESQSQSMLENSHINYAQKNVRKNINPLSNTDKDFNVPLSFETSHKINYKDSDTSSEPYMNEVNDKNDYPDKRGDNDNSNTNILNNRLLNHNVAAETRIATIENNAVGKTKIDDKPDEYLEYTSDEIECENNVFCKRSFRSCQLKKELFSPFIQKLILHNVGSINAQTMENNINEEGSPENDYSCLDSLKINTESSNGKTFQEVDTFKRVQIMLCDVVCESIEEDTKNQSMGSNDFVLENGAKNIENSGLFPDRNLTVQISASQTCTDLSTEIGPTESIHMTEKSSAECIHVEDARNRSIAAEQPENIEFSLSSSLLVSPDKTFDDNVTTVSEKDNLSNKEDGFHADVRDSDENEEGVEKMLTLINEGIITNSDVNTECSLNVVTLEDSSDKYVMKNKHNQDTNRPCLKRSLSDSALDSFNDSSDAFYSGWRSKRPKNKICNVLEPDVMFDSNVQNNRRKSISSIYNEQNVSFCILIDNNCIITEEEETEDQDEICFTNVSEACLTDLQESVNEYDTRLTPTSHSQEPLEEFNRDYTETQEVEESWIDDVGCMETIVSDDVAEDITISASSSPERMNSLENDESEIFINSDHTDKVKHIYGSKLCNDDVMFLETLYRTPQMDVNKIIINRESQVSEEYVQYYNKDSLEKVLSEPNGHEDLHSNMEMEPSDVNSLNPLDEIRDKNIQQEENVDKDVLLIEKSPPIYDTYNDNESNDFTNNESLFTSVDKTQDDSVHSCESSIDNVSSYSQNDEYISYTSSTSPEVSSTTSEERNSGILLKITNYKGSRVSQINDTQQETKSISCKFTELNDYSSSQNFKTNRPLITKAAQKYIPPLEETLGDLKIRLPLPQHSLLRLKQLKLLKNEPKPNKCNIKSKPDIPKKPKPKFEDVLKSIDEIQFKMHMEKSKKSKKTIPKVVIKKNENGSHYASTTNIKPFNPDLTGRKWQPWVFLEKNHFIDKMALKNKRKAIFNHRKNTYVLADKFRKYKSIGNAKFVISQPNMHSSAIGHLKCTIRLKHTY
ncbi:uncharacterized protein PF3D7_1120600-like isoform X2 [Plodia interpunctella]|uniref:uncharacterized protein PF3D7_1120600-like isoform X2 n=1 Tax=Plodia interpunctella TaxID=58824 RepID=UPI0023682C3A|nr:uncharacterized protein PF3D7_1120600-like isoform X2 [Plodia interpunctella]